MRLNQSIFYFAFFLAFHFSGCVKNKKSGGESVPKNQELFQKQVIEYSHQSFYLREAKKYVCTIDDLSDLGRYRGFFQIKEDNIVHIYSDTIVDATTFTYCSDPEITSYDSPYITYDKNFIYYGKAVKNTQQLDFYHDSLAKDSENRIYFRGNLISDLDFLTLLHANIYGVSMLVDSSAIYINGTKQDIDFETIQFSGAYHIKDKTNLYYLDHSGLVTITSSLENLDPTVLKCYPSERCHTRFFKYGDSIVKGSSVIANVDQNKYFQLLEDSYHIYESNDAYHYIKGEVVGESVEKLAKTTYSHLGFGYFVDSKTNQIMFFDSIVNKAVVGDLEVFPYKNKSYAAAKSDSTLFINQYCVKGIDPATISEIKEIHSGRVLELGYIASTGQETEIYLVAGQDDCYIDLNSIH